MQVKVLIRSSTRLLLTQVAQVRGQAELLATQAKCHVSGPIKQTEVSTKAPIFLRGPRRAVMDCDVDGEGPVAQCRTFHCNLGSASRLHALSTVGLLQGIEETCDDNPCCEG